MFCATKITNMKKRKIASVILIVSCTLLAAMAFIRLQSRPLQPSPDGGAPNIVGLNGIPASPVQRQEAVNSVRGQLEAFHQNDYEKALYYQSPWMRMSVGDARDFRNMMVTYYPEFTNFTRVRFGVVRSMMNGAQVVVPVSVTGKDGYTVNAIYMLVRGNDGIYRVTGVSGGRR
jgi:hypothetical protein